MTEKDWRNYQILNTIATGGTAVLYKAIQTSLDRPVVVKRLHSHLTSDPNFTRRFALEAKAAASLDHENIVRIIDFGSSQNNYYIVMEYIDGLSLKELIEKLGLPGEELSLLIAREICMGLDHAHQRGIIHRDIKPANIMITHEGQVKITDFGLAKLHESQTQQTVANTLLGTPLYMSPEQAIGDTIDGRSDLFSLGTICYEMMTGTQPFMGNNYASVIQNIISGTIPSPAKICRKISPAAESIVMKALNREPGKRFRTALEMARAIESHLGQGKILGVKERLGRLASGDTSVKTPAPETPDVRPGRKWKMLPAAAATVLVIAAAAFFGLNPERLSGLRTGLSALRSPDPVAPSGEVAGKEAMEMMGAVMTMAPVDPLMTVQPVAAPDTTAGAGAAADTAETTSAPEPETVTNGPATTESAPAGEETIIEPAGEAEGDSSGKGAPPVESSAPEDAAADTEEQPTPALGYIEINCEPSAEILVDGRIQTVASRYGPVEIQAGRHEIACRKTDYTDYRETVVITRGELSRRRVILQQLTGELHFDTTPGSSIYVDGTFKGTTPVGAPIILPVGLYRVELRKAGFKTWKSEVFIPAKETLRLQIKLVPN